MNVKQWISEIENKSDSIKSYEDLSLKFYEKLYNKKSSDITICNIFSKPLKSKFYMSKENNCFKKLPSYLFLYPIVKISLLIIIFLTVCIIYGIKSLKNNQLDIKEKFSIFITGCKQGLLKGIIFSLIIILIISIILCIMRIIIIKSYTNTLKKHETILLPIIKTLPQTCRSYEHFDVFTRIYYKYPDATYSQFIDMCEDVVRESKERIFSGIMFDIPFSNNFSSTQTSTNNKSKNEEENNSSDISSNNPNLPPDIESKTFSGSKNSEKDLNAMIGLNEVKKQIETLKNRIQFYGSANAGNSGNHMVFLGSAGTGKTTVARIITKILYDLGYIKKNQCVEISGDYLKSQYIGQTGDRTSAIIEYSKGGVLFIDEAYLLQDNNAAGNEAIGVLLKAMEDYRDELVVILAGYEEQITKLLASNEGFNSRIKYKIYFPDYSIEDMYKIFVSFISNYNNRAYLLDDNAKQILLNAFKLEKTSSSFGNARTVRNAADAIMDNFVDRSMRENSKSNIITIEDVKKYVDTRSNELQHETKNASAVNQIDESIIRLSELKQRLKNGSNTHKEDLNKLVGLDTLKQELLILENQKQYYNDTNINYNILLLGKNGSGKSTLTQILTGYLYSLGYIKENKYLEISAEFMKGSYVGHTSRRASSIISYATGGVLYIKNIDLLSDTSDSYSNEALASILDALSNSKNLIIIISGTDNGINKVFGINNNLFSLIYKMPNYSSDQLMQIFNLTANNNGFSVTQDALKIVLQKLSTTDNLTAIDAVQLFNLSKKKHIANYMGDSKNQYLITVDDVQDSNKSISNNKLKLNINLK